MCKRWYKSWWLYLSKVTEQMPIFPQKDLLEVSSQKDCLMAKEAWIPFEIQDVSCIQSHSVPLAIKVMTSTENDQMKRIKYTQVHHWKGSRVTKRFKMFYLLLLCNKCHLKTFQSWCQEGPSPIPHISKNLHMFLEVYIWSTYFVRKCTSGLHKIYVFFRMCTSEVMLEGGENSTYILITLLVNLNFVKHSGFCKNDPCAAWFDTATRISGLRI